MESKIRNRRINIVTLHRQVVAGLILYLSLAAQVWPAKPPVPPGQCKNGTTLFSLTSLSFGTFASEAAGQVAVSATGIRSSTGGILLMGGTISQAAFDINGCANSAYSIILPADSSLVSGVNSMTLTNFESYPIGSGVLDANGWGALQFGAALVVNYPQPAGNYSGTYIVEIVIQ